MRVTSWQTHFLRYHVAQQLNQHEGLDVFAVNHLLKEITDQNLSDASGQQLDHRHPLVRELAGYNRFFYSDLPDDTDQDSKKTVYVPLRVGLDSPYYQGGQSSNNLLSTLAAKTEFGEFQPYKNNEGNTKSIPTGTFLDLTSLISALNHARTDLTFNQRHHFRENEKIKGILLTSSNGSGKTTAARKAFLDCCCAPLNLAPRLGQFVPCWLESIGTELSRLEYAKPEHYLMRAILNLAFEGQQNMPQLHFMKRWLVLGPPILIFIDLNAIMSEGPDIALKFAQSLAVFQELYGRYGHRCVIGVRDASRRSDVLFELLRREHFDIFDLLPATRQQVLSYFNHFQNWREDIAEKLSPFGYQNHKLEVPRVRKILAGMLDRYLPQNSPKPVDTGLISTPLFMHFASVLHNDLWSEDMTLTKLYERLIENALKHDDDFHLGEFTGTAIGQQEHGRNFRKLIMARTALAIIHQGETATRLPQLERLQQLLHSPDLDATTRTNPAWHPPEKSHFYESPLWKNEFVNQATAGKVSVELINNLQQELAIRFTLLKAINQSEIGFAHDSMLYYFSGAFALTDWKVFETTSWDLDWQKMVVTWMASKPRIWRQPAAFLAMKLFDADQRAVRNGRDRYTWQMLISLVMRTDSPAMLRLLETYVAAIPEERLAVALKKILSVTQSEIRNDYSRLPILLLSFIPQEFEPHEESHQQLRQLMAERVLL